MIEATQHAQSCRLACDICNASRDRLRRLKRVVRCVCHTRKLAALCPYGEWHLMKELVACTDSDCAGDRNTRKSAFCSVLQVDGCVLSVICRDNSSERGLQLHPKSVLQLWSDRLATLARRLRVVRKTDESSIENCLSCRSICAHVSRCRTDTTNAHWTSCRRQARWFE